MKVVVCTTPPVEVPVITTVAPDTIVAVADAVRVNVDVAAGLAGVTGLGVKADAVTPLVRPEIERVTACVPAPGLTSRTETVDIPLVVPWTRVTLDGATLRL